MASSSSSSSSSSSKSSSSNSLSSSSSSTSSSSSSTTYGLKVYNPTDLTKFTVLTPKLATVISSGRITMSDSLNDDDTYGTNIDLPGTGAIPIADIGVLIFPVEHTHKITSIQLDITGDGTYLQNIGYMDDAQTYYEHNKTTGEMTVWTAGDLTVTDGDEFDHIAAIFPVAFWDIMGGTTFTSIQLFAATCYLIYDTSASSYKKVYTIGADGVSKSDYIITLKNYDY